MQSTEAGWTARFVPVQTPTHRSTESRPRSAGANLYRHLAAVSIRSLGLCSPLLCLLQPSSANHTLGLLPEAMALEICVKAAAGAPDKLGDCTLFRETLPAPALIQTLADLVCDSFWGFQVRSVTAFS